MQEGSWRAPLMPRALTVLYNSLTSLVLFTVRVAVYTETMQTWRAQRAASEAAVISDFSL